jgi:hypothetical protein
MSFALLAFVWETASQDEVHCSLQKVVAGLRTNAGVYSVGCLEEQQ